MTDATQKASANAETQKQSTSSEKDWKRGNKPENEDGIVHFDTTITKLVERENADGDMEWVEVMSDNLYPGEKLKRADDEEKQAEKQKAARQRQEKAAKERGTDK